MISIGILDNKSCDVGVMPSPSDIEGLKNEVIFNIQSDSGLDCGYTDNLYWQKGCNLLLSGSEVIEKSDIILVDDQFNSIVETYTKKIIIANIDYLNAFEKLLLFMNSNVDVYSFHEVNVKEKVASYNFKQLFIDFLKFSLGEPINNKVIQTFVNCKIVENGKIVHKPLLQQLNTP